MSKNPLPPEIEPIDTPIDEADQKKKRQADFWLGFLNAFVLLGVSAVLMGILYTVLYKFITFTNDYSTNIAILNGLVYLVPVILIGGAIIITLVRGRSSIVLGMLAFFGVLFACGLVAGVFIQVMCLNY